MSIQSFTDVAMRDLLEGVAPRHGVPAALVRIVQRKLVMLDAAASLDDLCEAPANQLEPCGDGEDRYSLRVDDEHRMTFTWTDAGPAEV